ncbi:hypothetical protein GCM10022323_19980 [Asaccharospora irregularis DSM 2635]
MVLSIFDENAITEYTVANPNKKPTIGNVNEPITGIDIPVIITNPAPSDVPEETPRVYGDAN